MENFAEMEKWRAQREREKIEGGMPAVRDEGCVCAKEGLLLRAGAERRSDIELLDKKNTARIYSRGDWCARLDSNQRPSGSEPNALSN